MLSSVLVLVRRYEEGSRTFVVLRVRSVCQFRCLPVDSVVTAAVLDVVVVLVVDALEGAGASGDAGRVF